MPLKLRIALDIHIAQPALPAPHPHHQVLGHGEVHHHLHHVDHGCPVYCGILPTVSKYCTDGITGELYIVHLVAVHHATPAVHSQPNPQDAPLVFDIELVVFPHAVGANAG